MRQIRSFHLLSALAFLCACLLITGIYLGSLLFFSRGEQNRLDAGENTAVYLLSGDEVLRAYTQDGSIPLDGARISTARAIRENFMLGSMGRFAPVSGAFCVLMAAVLWLFWLFQKKLLEKRLRHIAVSIENFDDLESAAAMSPALAAAYEKMREKFTAQLEDYKKLNSYLSHEQKNVLALVRTEMELNGEEEYLRDLSLLTDGIDNVLTLSETEDTTRREAVDAVLVCAEVCDSYRKLHPNLQFTFDEDENCEIYAVRRWIQRAVSNLVDNAVKYGGEGEISLDVRAKNGSVILRVTDHGAGIPPEEQERIFEYQYRIGALKKDGYGIGLSLVHHVCTLCGGFAAVESVPGVETTFYLSFPQM